MGEGRCLGVAASGGVSTLSRGIGGEVGRGSV